MMRTNNTELKVTEKERDTFRLALSPAHTPHAYRNRVTDLMRSGLSEQDACQAVATTPVVMELFCDVQTGLFAVESEPLQLTPLCNPFTGQEIPNENPNDIRKEKLASNPFADARAVTVSAEQLDKVLNYLWEREECSWDEMRRAECGPAAATGYDPQAVTGHIYHALHDLNESLLLDTQFRSLSSVLTRRMLIGLLAPIDVREIQDPEIQRIADLTEQFTKITLHLPSGEILDFDNEQIARTWHTELAAIVRSGIIPTEKV